MRQNMVLQRGEIGSRGLGRGKSQRRQPPRRIVDEHDQRAARPTSLKPVMRAAVDLDQLAKARTPLAELKHLLAPPRLRLPQTQLDLQLPHALARDRDPLQLRQLLGPKSRYLPPSKSLARSPTPAAS